MEGEQNLDLSINRTISFRERGLIYSYTFDRITPRDWEKYFDGIVATSENRGGETRTIVDGQTAASELVRSRVLSVDGYTPDFVEHKDWKQALPIRHVRLVAGLLLAVAPDTTTIRPIDPFHQEAILQCAWTSEEPGTMKYFTGLVHRFAPVTAEHERKFNRAVSETRVVGGSRTGKTIYPSRQKAFLALYDELIEAVEGYVVPDNGNITFWVGPCSAKEAIVREMDALHKVMAISQLFTPIAIDEDEEK